MGTWFVFGWAPDSPGNSKRTDLESDRFEHDAPGERRDSGHLTLDKDIERPYPFGLARTPAALPYLLAGRDVRPFRPTALSVPSRAAQLIE